MPILSFHVDELPDGNLRVYVDMPACICSRRESEMLDLILSGYAKESGQSFKSLGVVEGKSFTIPIHKG